MFYVSDTHSFLWYLSEDEKLGNNAKSVFDEAENGNVVIIVPTIVLAESLYIIEKQKFNMKFVDILKKLSIGWNYTTMPLDMDVIRRIEELRKLPELHDRIIVASANIIGASLITNDEAIKKSDYVKTIW